MELHEAHDGLILALVRDILQSEIFHLGFLLPFQSQVVDDLTLELGGDIMQGVFGQLWPWSVKIAMASSSRSTYHRPRRTGCPIFGDLDHTAHE